MQNKYVGDVGDFAKHGLLRFLSGETAEDDGDRLRLGLVWYLYHGWPHNSDGKHVGYLMRTPDDDKREYRDCDPELWETLRDLILSNARCVHCIQGAAVLPEDTLYYDAQLDYAPKMLRAMRKLTREYWFGNALVASSGADLGCLDPDNGISGDARMYRAEGPKFVYMDDLKAFWERGQSLVVYHHLGMTEPACEQIRAKVQIIQDELLGAEPISLLFHKGSDRVFFVVPQPERKEIIKARVSRMLDTPWSKHFERVG